LPVKHLRDAKYRLAPVLAPAQRSRFAFLMYNDVLEILDLSSVVEGITVVSSDRTVIELARQYKAGTVFTASDSGYSEDAARGIDSVPAGAAENIAVLPADVPQLAETDLTALDEAHEHGITLCPALIDGGTNALVFTPPLAVPLVFGPESLARYEQQALDQGIPVRILPVSGLQRDIDRPADLRWLLDQPSGGRAWSYLRDQRLSTITSCN